MGYSTTSNAKKYRTKGLFVYYHQWQRKAAKHFWRKTTSKTSNHHILELILSVDWKRKLETSTQIKSSFLCFVGKGFFFSIAAFMSVLDNGNASSPSLNPLDSVFHSALTVMVHIILFDKIGQVFPSKKDVIFTGIFLKPPTEKLPHYLSRVLRLSEGLCQTRSKQTWKDCF